MSPVAEEFQLDAEGRVSSDEAMRYLGITRPTLYRLIEQGKLHAPDKSPYNTRRGRLTFDPNELRQLQRAAQDTH